MGGPIPEFRRIPMGLRLDLGSLMPEFPKPDVARVMTPQTGQKGAGTPSEPDVARVTSGFGGGAAAIPQNPALRGQLIELAHPGGETGHVFFHLA